MHQNYYTLISWWSSGYRDPEFNHYRRSTLKQRKFKIEQPTEATMTPSGLHILQLQLTATERILLEKKLNNVAGLPIRTVEYTVYCGPPERLVVRHALHVQLIYIVMGLQCGGAKLYIC